MNALRTSVSGPTLLFGVGAAAATLGLWTLAPWLALVAGGAAAMALAVIAAMPRRVA